MKKVLKKLKAAFSRGRQRKSKGSGDEVEEARGADLQLWAPFLFVSVCFQELTSPSRPTTPTS